MQDFTFKPPNYRIPAHPRHLATDLGMACQTLCGQMSSRIATFDTALAAMDTLDRLREMIDALEVDILASVHERMNEISHDQKSAR